MGLLVEGRWQDVWYPTKSTGGRFVRKDAAFRNWITVDGSAGPTGIGGFKSEAGRYHLYVSLAGPLGAPHADHADVERARSQDLGVGGALADAGSRLRRNTIRSRSVTLAQGQFWLLDGRISRHPHRWLRN